MVKLTWDSDDFDASESEQGVKHSANSGNRSLRQGYQHDYPQLTRGLVGWWPLTYTSGSARDLSGNNNPGTVNGGITRGVAGKAGLQAMSLDGSDDYIDMGNSSIFDTPPFSISFWIKTSLSDSNFDNSTRPINKMDSGGNGYDGWGFIGDHINNTGSINFQLNGDTKGGVRAIGTTDVNDGEWHHIVGVYDSSNGTHHLYIDGVLEADNNSPDPGNISTTGILCVGSRNGADSFFPGEICDVRVYNRALTPKEIQTLYDWGNGDYANPPSQNNGGVSYYKLDGDATDSWNSNDGSSSSISYVEDSIIGKAASLDASQNSKITDSDFNGPQFPLSISYWIKWSGSNPDKYAGRPIWLRDDSGGELVHQTNSPTATVNYYNGNSSQIVEPETKAEWMHYAAIITSSKLEIYQNGHLRDTTSISLSNSSASIDKIILGDDGNGENSYEGLIDQFRIFNRELTQKEVFELYRYGTKGINMAKHMVNL